VSRIDRFGLAVGAGLAVPVAAGVAAATGRELATTGPVAAGVVVLLVVAVAGSLRPDAAVRVGGSEFRAALVAVPLLGAVLAVVLELAGTPGLAAAGWALVPAVGFGALALAAAGNAHSRAERDESRAEWVAAAPPAARRRWRLALAGPGGVLAVLAVAGSLVEPAVGPLVAVGLVGVAGGARAGRYRRYTAHDAGLGTRAGAGFARRLTSWDRFEGYHLTDEAVVLRRRDPWGFPVRFDRDDVDSEAVTAALAAGLED
jgi:hypothetical protein